MPRILGHSLEGTQSVTTHISIEVRATIKHLAARTEEYMAFKGPCFKLGEVAIERTLDSSLRALRLNE